MSVASKLTPKQHAAQDAKHAKTALAQLEAATGDTVIELGDVSVKVTNLDKVMYPAIGFTKRDVARYYMQVAPTVLAHLRGRALTLKRYPNGVEESFFYQKRAPAHRPDFVHTSDPIGDHQVEYVLADDVPTLLWVANLADIELHVLLSHAAQPMNPTVAVFDLDPGEGTDVLTCGEVALIVRDMFLELGLEAFPKTSGSKGLQVYVPLGGDDVTFDDTKPFARAVAEALEKQHPELVVHRMRKDLRRGKVLVDWSQNDDHKTTACAYSLRAKSRPTVSTPVTWSEVEDAIEADDATRLSFEHDEVVARLEQHGDLFEPVLTLQQSLPRLGS